MSPTTEQTTAGSLRRGWHILTWPVWNRDQHRLRAPLRAVLPLVCTFVAFAAVQTAVRANFVHPWREVVEAAGLAAVLVASVVLSARLLDRRSVTDYGLSFDRQWWRSLAVGGAIATAINAGAFAVAVGAGWATVVGFAGGGGALPFPAALLVVFAYVAVAASWEEFVFRGAMLKNLAEGLDGHVPDWAIVAAAVLLSSAVFAALHGGKVDHVGQYSYYVLAGAIFASVYVLSGDLALPIGFHVGYNVTMSAVFGLGTAQRTPELVVLDIVGPARWLGEEGLVHVVFAAVGGVLLLAYVRRREGRLGLADGVGQWTRR